MSTGHQQSFVESHVEPEFFACKFTRMIIKKHHHCKISASISFASLPVCVWGFARSSFAFGDIPPLRNMASEAPALPELEGVPALPEFPRQATYVERLFSDLHKIHRVDHCKGTTFSKQAKQAYDNVPRELCTMLTDCCPQCIRVLQGRKLVAGIKNIVTKGSDVRGKVNLIDFQSMPDGEFKFLLNYIDHGIKKLTSVPLVAKHVSSVAGALLGIFTEQGLPSILQTDNGGKFSGSATNHDGRRLLLDDEVITD
jgi:hypothetical protein